MRYEYVRTDDGKTPIFPNWRHLEAAMNSALRAASKGREFEIAVPTPGSAEGTHAKVVLTYENSQPSRVDVWGVRYGGFLPPDTEAQAAAANVEISQEVYISSLRVRLQSSWWQRLFH